MAFGPTASSTLCWIRSVWFERTTAAAASQAAGGLTLAELVAMRPRHVRDALAPGERFPGGVRPGRRRAQGLDLDGISPYVQGDDVRRIDWRATARTGRTQVKRYVAESHRARMLIVDLRAGLYFGTRTRLMAKTAALAAARLAWEAHGLHEPVGLVTLPGGEDLAPRRGRAHLLRLLDRLETVYGRRGAASDGSPSQCLEAAAGRVRFGDEIALLSDFGSLDPGFRELSRSLSASRRLQAFVVEDEIFTRPIPAGRYPIRRRAGAGRETIGLSRRAASAHGEVVAALRQELARDLITAGWSLAAARDLIPRAWES